MSISRLYPGLVLLLVAPFLLPGGPPFLDYPNHLARMRIAFAPDAFTRTYYEFQWTLVGNLGLEGVVALLHPVLSVEAATEAAAALAILLAAAGIAWLSHALHGRITPGAVLALAFTYSQVIQYGFLSYALGMGLAMLAFAGWVWSEDRAPVLRVALAAGACVVLFLSHTLAFVFYGIAVAGYMAGRLVWRTDRPLRARLGDGLLAALQAIPAGGLLVVANAGGAPSDAFVPPLAAKLENLAYLVFETALPATVPVVATAAVLAGLAVWRRRVVIAPRLIGPVAALAAAYLVLPISMGHGPSAAWGIDWRLLPFLVWIALVGLPDVPSGQVRRVAAGLAASAVLVLLAAIVTQQWLPWVRHEAALRACLAEVPRGARVASLLLPADPSDGDAPLGPPGVLHLAAWAVTDRSAFVPTLFAMRFQQPLSYADAYEPLRRAASSLTYDPGVSERVLAAFDYVLALAPRSGRTIPPGILAIARGAPCEGRYFALLALRDGGQGS